MPSFTTEGIIVKRSNFGEADRILTVVTPYRGKIRIIARGVRKVSSRRGGNVELLNKVRLHTFKGQGLPVLTEAESISTYPKIKGDLVLSSYASHVVELAERFLPEEQINLGAYQLLATILDILETNPRQIFIRAYEIRLLSELGFWSLDQISASNDVKKLLQALLTSSWEEINSMKIDHAASLEIERILRYYMEKILESTLRSVRIIEKLKKKL